MQFMTELQSTSFIIHFTLWHDDLDPPQTESKTQNILTLLCCKSFHNSTKFLRPIVLIIPSRPL